jgi:hypothetical protein
MKKSWLDHIGPNPSTRHRHHCFAAGYKAGLWDALNYLLDFERPAIMDGVRVFAVDGASIRGAITEVERTGELPKEQAIADCGN